MGTRSDFISIRKELVPVKAKFDNVMSELGNQKNIMTSESTQKPVAPEPHETILREVEEDQEQRVTKVSEVLDSENPMMMSKDTNEADGNWEEATKSQTVLDRDIQLKAMSKKEKIEQSEATGKREHIKMTEERKVMVTT